MGSRRKAQKDQGNTAAQEEKKESTKQRKKVKLILGYSPDFGTLELMGYTFRRGVPTEVAAEDVEELKKKNGFLKEV